MKKKAVDAKKTREYWRLRALADQVADQMRFTLGLGSVKRNHDSYTRADPDYFRGAYDFFTARNFHILRLEISTADSGGNWYCGGQTHVVQLSKIQEILDVVVMAINT